MAIYKYRLEAKPHKLHLFQNVGCLTILALSLTTRTIKIFCANVVQFRPFLKFFY